MHVLTVIDCFFGLSSSVSVLLVGRSIEDVLVEWKFPISGEVQQRRWTQLVYDDKHGGSIGKGMASGQRRSGSVDRVDQEMVTITTDRPLR